MTTKCVNCGKTFGQHYAMRCESGSDESIWEPSTEGTQPEVLRGYSIGNTVSADWNSPLPAESSVPLDGIDRAIAASKELDRTIEGLQAVAAERQESSVPQAAQPTGAELIAAERERQIRAEGWSSEHDDEHEDAEMVAAARAYCFAVSFPKMERNELWLQIRGYWPWAMEWWKPSSDPIRNLVKAGALIAAEIDRLQRAAVPAPVAQVDARARVMADKVVCKWCQRVIRETPATWEYRYVHDEDAEFYCWKHSPVPWSEATPAEPEGTQPRCEPVPCPGCGSPIFIRENNTVVAHYNRHGDKCFMNEKQADDINAQKCLNPAPVAQVDAGKCKWCGEEIEFSASLGWFVPFRGQRYFHCEEGKKAVNIHEPAVAQTELPPIPDDLKWLYDELKRMTPEEVDTYGTHLTLDVGKELIERIASLTQRLQEQDAREAELEEILDGSLHKYGTAVIASEAREAELNVEVASLTYRNEIAVSAASEWSKRNSVLRQQNRGKNEKLVALQAELASLTQRLQEQDAHIKLLGLDHLEKCGRGAVPIGSPGCVCEVVSKGQLTALTQRLQEQEANRCCAKCVWLETELEAIKRLTVEPLQASHDALLDSVFEILGYTGGADNALEDEYVMERLHANWANAEKLRGK